MANLLHRGYENLDYPSTQRDVSFYSKLKGCLNFFQLTSVSFFGSTYLPLNIRYKGLMKDNKLLNKPYDMIL